MPYANVPAMELRELCRFGLIEELKARLSSGADFRSLDSYGWSPMMIAARHGHAECAHALAVAGADVEEVFSGFVHPGYTPLMMAVDYGHVDAAMTLCHFGASPFTQSKDGSTALSLSVSRRGKPTHDESLRLALAAAAQAFIDQKDLDAAIPDSAAPGKRPRI